MSTYPLLGQKLADERTLPVRGIAIEPSDQFMRDVLCTAMEGGSNYWAVFQPVEYTQVPVSDQDNAHHPVVCQAEVSQVKVGERNDLDGDESDFDVEPNIVIGLDELRTGIINLLAGGMFDKDIKTHKPGDGDAHIAYRAQVFQAVAEDDAGQVDCELADLILQAAALGCIRYG